jgi:hypothetical protein
MSGMYKCTCILLLLILASCAPSIPFPPYAGPGWLAGGPRLIATTSAGRPIAAGEYLFWFDRRDGGAIYGYHRPQNREFAVSALRPGARPSQLASNGETLVWLDTNATSERIRAIHLPTQHIYNVPIPAVHTEIADLAVDQSVLYYWDHAPDHRGIFAYDLAGGFEQRMSDLPRATGRGRLAAADGVVVWSEYGPADSGLPPIATLRMARHADPFPARVIAQGRPWSGALAGFAVSGDHIVWSFALEQQVWLYTISTGERRVISAGQASRPLIEGNTVVWNVRLAEQRRQGIAVYDLASGTLTPLIAAGRAYAEAQGLDQRGNIAFTVDHRPALQQDLYLASSSARGLQLAVAAERPPDPVDPLSRTATGQVQAEDKQFIIAGASNRRWTFNGVHLILPSRGINGSSFSADTLADGAAAAERREWLDRAQQIGVKSIRIYVDMPGDTNLAMPPSAEQLYRFARDELSPRDMRLALVIHNSGRFDDPGGRKMAWLRALLDRFGNMPNIPRQGGRWHIPTDRSSLLAYINADNEINLHSHTVDAAIPGSPYCRPDDAAQAEIDEDCFDHPNPDQRRRYIQAALGWVERVRDTVKQHRTGRNILVTAGMSVDLEKDILGDGRSAVLNYFTRIRGDDGRLLPPLADLLDFIGPHSYTAQPYSEIVEPIERAEPFFAKPILLEEFGYPTDPIAQPHPQHPNEYKETSLSVQVSSDGTMWLVPNRQGLPAGKDLGKLCRYLPKLGSFGDSPKRCNPSAPYVVQMNLEAIFDLEQVAGGIAFMLADSNEKDDGRRQCYAPNAELQLSKNLFSGLFATNSSYRCGGTVNTGRGQIKNTGYRVCVAYRTRNPQLGDYRRRVAACEIDL